MDPRFPLRAFRQEVDDQLVTLFGADLPSQPTAKIGHYVVGNAGDVSAIGCTAAVRTVVASRVQGSIAYSLTKAQMRPADDLRYLVLLAPSALYRSNERIHDVATSIETNDAGNVDPGAGPVPRQQRLRAPLPKSGPSRARFAFRCAGPAVAALLNFTSAKWEMLIAVRDFFSETAVDQSVFDELLVVRPPKRIVGGVTMHF